jgi:hypothetical protein
MPIIKSNEMYMFRISIEADYLRQLSAIKHTRPATPP